MTDIRQKIKVSGLKGSAPKPKGFSLSLDADKFSAEWSLDFADPYVVTDSDLVTIDVDLYAGLAASIGEEGNLLNNGEISSWSINLGDSLTSSVNGIRSGYEDPTKSSEKAVYFVNRAWIDRMSGGKKSWTFRDNALYWIKGTRLRTSGKLKRIEHADLPDINLPIDSYRLEFASNHHSILAYIARQFGYTLITNVPNVTVNHSFIIESGSSYVEALNKLVSLWNPFIRLDSKPTTIDGVEYPGVLYVLETTGDAQNKTQPRTVVLSNKAIQNIRITNSGPDRTDLVDKVLIKGGAISANVELPEPGQLKLTQLDPMELDPEHLLNFFHVEQMAGILGAKKYGDYKKGFNQQDAPDQTRIDKVLKYETIYQNPNDRTQLLLVAEMTESLDESGQTVHVHNASNQYADTGELIRSIETEQALVNEPGVPFKRLREVLRRTIDQSRIYDGMQRSNVLEIVEEPVVVTKVIPRTGDPYYAGAVRLIQAQSQNRVSTDVSTTQELIEMTTRVKMSKVSRVTKTVLRQIEMEWDNLSGTMHVQTQILADPRIHDADEEPKYYKEINKPGVTEFHKSVTVEHPDIVTDIVAQMVADLIFLRSSLSKRELSVSLIGGLLIPILDTAFDIRIPDQQVIVNGTNVRNISGGTYRLVKSDTRAAVGERDYTTKQTLSLRSVL